MSKARREVSRFELAGPRRRLKRFWKISIWRLEVREIGGIFDEIIASQTTCRLPLVLVQGETSDTLSATCLQRHSRSPLLAHARAVLAMGLHAGICTPYRPRNN